MPVTDAHCHFFSARFFETLARQRDGSLGDDPVGGVTGALGWEPPGPPEALADRWCAELDQHGVARAALMASVPGDEESVAAAVARHPARFVGFFMFDPTTPDASDRARRAFSEQGLRCVCLFPAMQHYRLDGEAALRLFEIAASFDHVAVFVHCGVLSVGVRKKLGLPSPFDVRLGNPLDLQTAAARHPDLPIIIPHFGAGFLHEALMTADLCPSIHFDTSSSNGWIKYHPGLTLADVFTHTLAVVGPDRLLFGTDSSFFPRGWQRAVHDAQRTILTDLGLDPQSVDKVFQGNFARLFPTRQG